MTLFECSINIEGLTPLSLTNSMHAATNILRSDVFKYKLANIYGTPEHIEKASLNKLLSRNNVFIIDRIRQLDSINARAATLCQYDPWRIYLNPLLLLEMKDREKEEYEINVCPLTQQGDMISAIDTFDTNDNPSRRPDFNSLMYIEQCCHHTQQKEKKHKVEDIQSSTLSVTDKNCLMLTILLIHEACHLLNHAFSSRLIKSQAIPVKSYKRSDGMDACFKDIGHMLEKELFGYVIQHAVSRAFITPFAVHHIIGCEDEVTADGAVLTSSQELLQLLQGHDLPITEHMLRLERVSSIVFHGRPAKITISGRDSSSVDNLSRILLENNDEDEDEDDYNVYDPLSAYIRA
jgi:hypothetical protein